MTLLSTNRRPQKRRCAVPACGSWAERGAQRCRSHRHWTGTANKATRAPEVDSDIDPFGIDVGVDAPHTDNVAAIELNGEVTPGQIGASDHTHEVLFDEIDTDGPRWKAEVVERHGQNLYASVTANPDLEDRLHQIATDGQRRCWALDEALTSANRPQQWGPEARRYWSGAYVDALVRGWAEGGPDPEHHMIQARIAELVQGAGAGDEYFQRIADIDEPHRRTANQAQERLHHEAPLIDSVITSMYLDTQRDLADRGLLELQLLRGMGWERGEDPPPPAWAADAHHRQSAAEAEVDFRPTSAWTTSFDIAEGFAQGYPGGERTKVMVYGNIPAPHVLCTPRTGFGCWDEREVVVMANRPSRVLVDGVPDYEDDDLWPL